MSASTLTDAAKERQKSKELKKCMEAMLDRLRCRTLVTDGGTEHANFPDEGLCVLKVMGSGGKEIPWPAWLVARGLGTWSGKSGTRGGASKAAERDDGLRSVCCYGSGWQLRVPESELHDYDPAIARKNVHLGGRLYRAALAEAEARRVLGEDDAELASFASLVAQNLDECRDPVLLGRLFRGHERRIEETPTTDVRFVVDDGAVPPDDDDLELFDAFDRAFARGPPPPPPLRGPPAADTETETPAAETETSPAETVAFDSERPVNFPRPGEAEAVNQRRPRRALATDAPAPTPPPTPPPPPVPSADDAAAAWVDAVLSLPETPSPYLLPAILMNPRGGAILQAANNLPPRDLTSTDESAKEVLPHGRRAPRAHGHGRHEVRRDAQGLPDHGPDAARPGGHGAGRRRATEGSRVFRRRVS